MFYGLFDTTELQNNHTLIYSMYLFILFIRCTRLTHEKKINSDEIFAYNNDSTC